MEYDVNYNKVGAGIITISVLHFIGCAFTVISLLINLLFSDFIKETLATAGQEALAPSTSSIVISFISTLLLLIFVILILTKKAVGVYGYFAIQIFSLVYAVISAGFSPLLVLNLILPLLMLLFIVKKKHIYGFGDKNQDANI